MDVQVSMPPPPPPPPPPPAFFAETTTSQVTSLPPPQPVTTTATVNVAAPATQDRIWLHPWTVNEMRENASQWSLAGDAGVLLYLEQFSDKLTQRADAIQQHISQTITAVKSTHTRVSNCLNEFTSLANTQFIENRVYDEDETADNTVKKDEQSAEKTNATETQEKVLQRYVEAIQYGLAILDTHFERVEAKLDNNQNGGSSFVDNDEDVGASMEPILEPKDPYIFRPLPYLIGTAEFMQDDYVGLGELLIRDEDGYEVARIEKVEIDSALSSEYEDEDEDEKDGNDKEDFQAEMTPAPIVPAGTSRPDFTKPLQPTTTLTDDEGDDDDPFGISKNNITRIDNIQSKPAIADDDLFSEETKPPPPPPAKANAFALDSDEGDDDFLNTSNQKPPPITRNNDSKFDDASSVSSKESDEPEERKPVGLSMLGGAQQGMSELQKAVLQRRKAIGDPDLSDNDDDDDDEIIKKPAKKRNETTKTKSELSSNTISNLTSQPLTTPTKIPQTSIFGENDDDDDDDPFGDSIKSTPVIPPSITKVDTKIPPKKEKDIFDESEDDDPFAPKKPTPKADPTPTQKIETTSTQKTQPILKRTPIIVSDHSDGDELFGEKKTPSKPAPIPSTSIVPQNSKLPDSDKGELFIPSKPIAKPPPPTTTTLLTDDEDLLFNNSKPSVLQNVSSQAPVPVVVPPVKRSQYTADDDSDDNLFDKPNKTLPTPIAGTSKGGLPTKHDDDDSEDDKLLTKPVIKPTILPKDTRKPDPITSSDEEDVFPSKSRATKVPPVVSSPLQSETSTKTDNFENSFGVSNSVKPLEKKKSDDSDEEPVPERQLNKEAVPEGQKASVRALAGRMNIPLGGPQKNLRPRANLITEESPKPSDDDNQPIKNIEPSPAATVKKISTLGLDSDDDDDDLFGSSKKKETPVSRIDEQKPKTTGIENENKSGKLNIKDLASRIILPTGGPMPSALQKSIPKEDDESNNTTHTTSNEESTVDKTVSNMLMNRAKPAARTRARPTKQLRSAEAAAASTNDTDDFFASSKSTTTVTSSPPVATPATPRPSVAVPVIPPPSVTVTVIPPPPVAVPVTGLPDKSAAITAISAKQTNLKEKKKFSLFDPDDSEIDELLFGFSKKNKSPVITKATTKSSALPLDDDIDDFLSKRPATKKPTKPVDIDDTDEFLSKRPTTKKPTKPVDIDDTDEFLSKRPPKKTTKSADNDDIFSDIKGKDPQTNKAKKDWSIMNKSTTDEKDDIFNETSTKSSSTTSKPKTTNVKSKSTKSFDDLFDDPLEALSKR